MSECEACDRLTRMLGRAAYCGKHFTPSTVRGDGIRPAAESERRADPDPGQASLFSAATTAVEQQPRRPEPPPPLPPPAPPPEPKPEPPPSETRRSSSDPAAQLVAPRDADVLPERRDGQVQLFADEEIEWWRPHWRGMPEYEQEHLKPWKTLFVHFERREDLEAFAKLIGQDIKADSTRSLWYPKQDMNRVKDLRWVDLSGDGDGIDKEFPITDDERDIMEHVVEEINL